MPGDVAGPPSWDEITTAVGLGLGGDREEGAEALAHCWDRTGEDDHAQRCVIAHYLADLQPDLDAEVSWDEWALAAFAHVGVHDLAAIGIPDARGMAPSLHLNLGDGYLRRGRLAEAKAQLAQGLAYAESLDAEGYGAHIRQGLARLADRVRAADS